MAAQPSRSLLPSGGSSYLGVRGTCVPTPLSHQLPASSTAPWIQDQGILQDASVTPTGACTGWPPQGTRSAAFVASDPKLGSCLQPPET